MKNKYIIRYHLKQCLFDLGCAMCYIVSPYVKDLVNDQGQLNMPEWLHNLNKKSIDDFESFRNSK